MKLIDTISDKDSGLYALLFLLDSQQYVYYDEDDDADIAELEAHLKTKDIPYTKGQKNRKYLTTNYSSLFQLSELKDLLSDVSQLISGWNATEAEWSEWDKKVHLRVQEFQLKIDGKSSVKFF